MMLFIVFWSLYINQAGNTGSFGFPLNIVTGIRLLLEYRPQTGHTCIQKLFVCMLNSSLSTMYAQNEGKRDNGLGDWEVVVAFYENYKTLLNVFDLVLFLAS